MASPDGIFQMSCRFILYDTLTNQTRQNLIICDVCGMLGTCCARLLNVT